MLSFALDTFDIIIFFLSNQIYIKLNIHNSLANKKTTYAFDTKFNDLTMKLIEMQLLK